MEAAKAHGCAPWFMGSEHEILLDHIDALTAERDALLNLVRWCRNDRPSAHSDELWQAINDALRGNSPSPVEDGET